MPTYEYRCTACQHRFERFQKISDAPARTCPECKKRRVERLISTGGGIVFKGSGFYATDYRKGGPSDKGDANAESGDGSKRSPGEAAPDSGSKKAADADGDAGGKTKGDA